MLYVNYMLYANIFNVERVHNQAGHSVGDQGWPYFNLEQIGITCCA